MTTLARPCFDHGSGFRFGALLRPGHRGFQRYGSCFAIIVITSRVSVEGKSSVCLMCL